MAGKENLKPIRSADEAREKGKKGGKASGKARKERKQLKDELLALLSDGDTQAKICTALIRQAQRGNIKAFETVRDTIGEKPMENVALDIGEEMNEAISAIDMLIKKKWANNDT